MLKEIIGKCSVKSWRQRFQEEVVAALQHSLKTGKEKRDSLQLLAKEPNSDGLQPTSDGLQPNRDGL